MTLQVLSVLKRHLTVFRRTLITNVTYSLIEPLLYLSAMGFGVGSYVEAMDGMSYMQFIAPGMVASSAMWASTFECTYGSFMRLHFEKTFHAMLAAPVSVGDVVAGEILFAAIKNIVFGSVVLAVVAALGQVHSLWALLIPLFLVLPGLVFAILALIYTGSIKHIDYLNYYITLFITPLFLFSGVFFPASSLPGWAQALLWANPLFHTVEVCRALALGQLAPGLWSHVGVLLMLTVLLARLPVRLISRQLIS
ncbi:ABC transporter permease [Propionispora hippei]|uniref:Transport permease protein n=1 Tax=Propionispora hippei DSM 15287 TaxID=1123003 RepID=A0A1M6HWN6_9FIRM|nr:ABC transporter permease [Propionispora hippei]SHJ26652.1 lipooligosaccharide transport system permease protein [Propionispora hippei DSM 15287]